MIVFLDLILLLLNSPNTKDYKYQKTFRGSDILRNKENYEIEIEYIGSSTNDGSKIITNFHKDLKAGKIIPSVYKFTRRKTFDLELDEDYEIPYDPEEDFYMDSPGYFTNPFDKIIGKRCFVKKDYWQKDSSLSGLYEKIKDESVFKDESLITGVIKTFREFYEDDNYEELTGKYVLLNFSINNEVWIPVTEIFSDDFDIDSILSEYTEIVGGASLPSWPL